MYLEVGNYTYPFQIDLPNNIPSSFEHTFGKIRYSLQGTIDIPWAFDKHTVKTITVISNLDLNQLSPTLRQPYGLSETKILCCGCCASDPITATFNVLKCGFVPGESLIYNISIDNKSNRDVIETTIKLVQEIKLTGSSREIIVKTTKVKTCYRDVVNVNLLQIIAAKTNVTLNNNYSIIVPPVSATSTNTCKIIEIRYYVVFTFGCRGSANKDMSIPITIGTIPLSNPSEKKPSLDNSSNNLPSYEECVYGAIKPEIAESIKGEMFDSDASTFKPLYPYYKDFSIENK